MRHAVWFCSGSKKIQICLKDKGLSYDDISHISNVACYTENTFCTSGFQLGLAENQHDDGYHQKYYAVDEGLALCGQRGQQRGGTQNEENIENTGTNGISESKLVLTLAGSYDGGYQLRQGGSYSNDGQTD